MSDYIIRLPDGRQIDLKNATVEEVASAISIIKISKDPETSIKSP